MLMTMAFIQMIKALLLEEKLYLCSRNNYNNGKVWQKQT